MTTQEKAHIAPILQTIADTRAINSKAIKIDLYYIPKFKGTRETFAYDVELVQTCYAMARSDVRDVHLGTIGATALLKLYTEYNIYIVPEDSEHISCGYHNYITLRLDKYRIIVGL